VDAIVSTESREGDGRTFVALEDVELLGLRGGAAPAGAAGSARTGTALATLRVTLRQAVYLAAAENFGREIRLLVRPPGDEAHLGRTSISEGEL
jgi:pilus assembly protein CpaB